MNTRLRHAIACSLLLVLVIAPATRANDAALRQALTPHVTHLKLKPDHWRALAERQVVTRELSGGHAKEMASFGALLVAAAPTEIVAAFRTLAAFKQSQNTLACDRFSPLPSPDDLAGLKLKDKDALELMRAKVQASGIKLSAADIARLQTVAGPKPGFSQQLINKLTAEYKQLLLGKVRAYLAEGGAGLGDYADQEEPVNAGESLQRLLHYQSTIAQHNAPLYTLLAEYPRQRDNQAESFVYWAVQKFGKLKPVLSLVHVLVHQEGARTFIASQQIYASHYTEAGFSIAELIPFTDAQGRQQTLVAYTVRLQVDLLGGTVGFMKRRMAQPRMLETLQESLLGLRRHVEAAQAVVAK